MTSESGKTESAAPGRAHLNPSLLRIADIIEALRFGDIDGLTIQDGLPKLAPSPRITQKIKLGADGERHVNSNTAGSILKREFRELFEHLASLENGAVHVEVRHGLPFRLIVERRAAELIAEGSDTATTVTDTGVIA
jgi:hypothetical protein